MKKRVLSLLLMLVMVVTAVPFFAFSASAEEPVTEETVFDYTSLYVTSGLIYALDFYRLNDFWGEEVNVPASPADSFTGTKISGGAWTSEYKAVIEKAKSDMAELYKSFLYRNNSNIKYTQYMPNAGTNSWNDTTGENQKISVVFGKGYLTMLDPHSDCYISISGVPADGVMTQEVVAAVGNNTKDTLVTFRDLHILVDATTAGTVKFPGTATYNSVKAYTAPSPLALSLDTTTPFTLTLTDERVLDSETREAAHTVSMWANGQMALDGVSIADPPSKDTDKNNTANTLIGYSSKLPSNIYAVRYYDRAITEAERTQNYFADLCKWYKLDMSLFASLSDNYREKVMDQFLEAAADEEIVIGGGNAEKLTLQTALNDFSSDVVYGELTEQDGSAAAMQFRQLAQSLLADVGGVLGLPVDLRAPVYAAALALTAPTRADFGAAVAAAIDKVLEDNYGDYINKTELTYKDLYVKQENLVLWMDFFAARATDGNFYMEYEYSDAPTTASGGPLPSGYTANWHLPKYKDGKVANGLNPDKIFIPHESQEAEVREKYIYRGGDFFTFADIPDAKWGHSNVRTWGDGRLMCGLNNSFNVKSPGTDKPQVTYQFVTGWENNDDSKQDQMNVQLDGFRGYFAMDVGGQGGYFSSTGYDYYGYGVSTDTYTLSNNALMGGKPSSGPVYVGDSLDITLTLDKFIGNDEGHYFIQQFKTNEEGATEYLENETAPIALNINTYARLYRYKIDGAWYYLRVTGSGSTATYEARYAETMAEKPKFIVDADGYRVESVPVIKENGVMKIDWANAVYALVEGEKVEDTGALAETVWGPCYKNPFTEVEFGTPGAVGPITYYGTYDMGIYANGDQYHYVSGLSYQKSDIGWVGNSGNMTFYAVRTYDCVLSEADIRQNHFADLAGFYGLDLSLYALLSDAERVALHDDLRTLQLGLDYESGVAAYEEAIDKYLYSFDSAIEGAEHFLEICHAFGLDTRTMKDLSPESLTRIFAAFKDLDPAAASYAPIVQKAVSETVAAEIDAHYAAAYGHKTIAFEGWQLHKNGDFGLRALYSTDLARVKDIEQNGGAKVMTGVLVAKYDKNGIADLDQLRLTVSGESVTAPEGVTLVQGYWAGQYDEAAVKDGQLMITKDSMIDLGDRTETAEISAVLKNEKFFYRGFTVIVVGNDISIFYEDATADGKTGAQSIYSLSRVAKKQKMSEVNIQKAMNICDRDSFISVEVGQQSIANFQIVISSAVTETALIQSSLNRALGFRLNEVRAADAAGKTGMIHIGAFDNQYDANCYGISILGGNIYIWYNSNAKAADACALFVEFIDRMCADGETAVFPANAEFVRRLAD